MTIAQTLLKHWYAIGLVSILAPLIALFGFVNAEQELANGIPWKYAFALVSIVGAYTLSQVNKALTTRRPNVQPQKPPIQERNDSDVFNQFGEQP